MNTLISDSSITVTEHGAVINRNLSLEEWQNAMKEIRRVKHAYHAVLADLTGYGTEHFGEQTVADAMEQMEFDLDDSNKAAAISNLSLSFRTLYSLNSEHAFILSAIKDDDEREEWAKKCKEHNLTALELKRSIQAGKIMRKEDLAKASGQGAGVPTVQAVRFQFERWCRAVGDKEKILNLPKPERRQLLTTLEPIIELAAEVQLSLEDLVSQ